MKKIRIIITMICLMLCMATSAQTFVVPTPSSKPSTRSNKVVPPPKVLPPPKETTPPPPHRSGKRNEEGQVTDPTTGAKVKGIERSLSIEELETLANEGDVTAHTQLGMYYFDKDDQKALAHLIVGVNVGNPLAQYYFGCVYYAGKLNVEMDKKKAASYFILSAQQNHAPAQYGIAVCLYNGEGVEQDREAAQQWMEKAAQNGYAEAKEYLETHSFE